MMGPLDVLLSQVPYTNRKRVKDDVKNLTEKAKAGALLPKIGQFVREDGIELRLLLLGGTIPIFYGGNQYNIPVDLYLPEKYPIEPPMLYVRPTPNMTIKGNHRHVDMQGKVYLPYLHEWNANSSLVQLVEIASSVFSIDPPLFAKPATTTPSTMDMNTYPSTTAWPPNYVPYGSTNTTNTAAATANNNNSAYPTAYGTSYGTTSVAQASTMQTSIPTDTVIGVAAAMGTGATAVGTTAGSGNGNGGTIYTGYGAMSSTSFASQAEQKRKKLLLDVTSKMQDALIRQQQKYRDEIVQEFEHERYLTEHKQEAERVVTQLQETALQLSRGSEVIALQLSKLQGYAQELETKRAQEAEQEQSVPLDAKVLEQYDDLSLQIVRVSAELLAINDTFYWLEKALITGDNASMKDYKLFQSESRKLSRQQFMSKALLKKILARCRQEEAMYQPLPAPLSAATATAMPPTMSVKAPTLQSPVSTSATASPVAPTMSMKQTPAPVPAPSVAYYPPTVQHQPLQQQQQMAYQTATPAAYPLSPLSYPSQAPLQPQPQQAPPQHVPYSAYPGQVAAATYNHNSRPGSMTGGAGTGAGPVYSNYSAPPPMMQQQPMMTAYPMATAYPQQQQQFYPPPHQMQQPMQQMQPQQQQAPRPYGNTQPQLQRYN